MQFSSCGNSGKTASIRSVFSALPLLVEWNKMNKVLIIWIKIIYRGSSKSKKILYLWQTVSCLNCRAHFVGWWIRSVLSALLLLIAWAFISNTCIFDYKEVSILMRKCLLTEFQCSLCGKMALHYCWSVHLTLSLSDLLLEICYWKKSCPAYIYVGLHFVHCSNQKTSFSPKWNSCWLY